MMRTIERGELDLSELNKPKNKELSQYRLNLENSAIQCGEVVLVNLGSYSQTFSKFDAKKTNSDHFVLFFVKRRGYGFFPPIWHDADFGFVLTKPNRNWITKRFSKKTIRDTAIACIGFNVDDTLNPSVCTVVQIQGVRGKECDLMSFKWERMLVKLAIDWARGMGVKTMKVVMSVNQRWYYESKKDSFYMKYDVTARRSGFKLNPQEKIYFLELN